jgi:hypothetical protein
MLEPVSTVPRTSVISGHFPEITLRCMLHVFPLFICIFVQIFNPSFAGQAMNLSPQELREIKDKLNSSPAMLEFRHRIGYDEAVTQEKQNGLILIDFRQVSRPSFMATWPYVRDNASDPWNHNKRDYSYFSSWRAKDTSGDITIDVEVFNTYEDARREFLSTAKTSSFNVPYEKCPKKIGTLCAVTLPEKDTLFFVYRNVMVRLDSTANDTITEKTAEWLFEVLKAFPRDPMDAPFELR